MITKKTEYKREQAVLAAFKKAKKEKNIVPLIPYFFSIYYLRNGGSEDPVKPKSIAQLMENIDLLRKHLPSDLKASRRSMPSKMPGGTLPQGSVQLSAVHQMFLLTDFLQAWARQGTDDACALRCLESFIGEQFFYAEPIHAVSILYEKIKYLVPGRNAMMLVEDFLGIRHVLRALQGWAADSGYAPLSLMVCLVESYASVFPEVARRNPIGPDEMVFLQEMTARRAAVLPYGDFESVLHYFAVPRESDGDGKEREEHMCSLVSAVADRMYGMLPDTAYAADMVARLQESAEMLKIKQDSANRTETGFFSAPAVAWITLSAYAAVLSDDSEAGRQWHALQWAEVLVDIDDGPGAGERAAAKWQGHLNTYPFVTMEEPYFR